MNQVEHAIDHVLYEMGAKYIATSQHHYFNTEQLAKQFQKYNMLIYHLKGPLNSNRSIFFFTL